MSKSKKQLSKEKLVKALELVLSSMSSLSSKQIADQLADAVITAIIETTEKGDRRAERSGARSEGSLVWDSYEQAYGAKYGVPPVRNAQTNAQAARLVMLVGAEDSIKLVAFYVEQRDEYYARSMHPLHCLVTDWQKLLTRMRTGMNVSRIKAIQGESAGATISSTQEYLNRKYAKGEDER